MTLRPGLIMYIKAQPERLFLLLGLSTYYDRDDVRWDMVELGTGTMFAETSFWLHNAEEYGELT